VLAALQDQELELVDALPIEPAAATGGGPPGGRRRGRPGPAPASQAVELRLPVQGNEGAVVLLEQDGVYRWKLPDQVARPKARRRGVTAEPAPGIATFRIELHATAPRGQRGIPQLVHRAVRVFVLKFGGTRSWGT
jgi:hypothetical protein